MLPPLLRVGERHLSELDRLEFEYQLAEMVWSSVLQREQRPPPEGVQIARWNRRRASGDFAVAARGPKGEVRVLVGDMTGRGLAAALAVQPISAAFFSAVKRFATPDGVMAEINDQMRTCLPRGFFCAAAMVEMSPDQRQFAILNCGFPDVLFLKKSGETASFRSLHPPLGIMKRADFSKVVVTGERTWQEPIVLCSDGVTNATALRGQRFAEEGLSATLDEHRFSEDLAGTTQRAVLEFAWPRLPQDDITVAVIR